MKFYTKFPDIRHAGLKLVWDWRQEKAPKEIVVVRPFLDRNAIDQLLSREPRKVVSSIENADSIRQKYSGEIQIVEDPSLFLGQICRDFYSECRVRLPVFAVTGTNGKSSTAFFISQLFPKQEKVAVLGSLGLRIFESFEEIHREETGFTTPDCPSLHCLIHNLKSENVKALIMEASSQALALGRMKAIDVSVALFLNLSQDHLDFHRDMDTYFKDKVRLFEENLLHNSKSVALVNRSDPWGKKLLERFSAVEFKVLSFHREESYRVIDSSLSGIRLKDETQVWKLPLVGDFQAENFWAAKLAIESFYNVHVGAENCEKLASEVGRLEKIEDSQGRHIFVDYAHTPDALEKAAATLAKSNVGGGRLFVLFGCGGDRDSSKRPLMVEAAEKFADCLVFTSDNPRNEDPQKILDELLEHFQGLKSRKREHSEVDRRQAIHWTLGQARKGDIVLIAGKGHEDYQLIQGVKRPFSDQAVVREFLRSN